KFFHELLETPVKRPAPATRVREDEASLLDEALQVLPGLRRKIGDVMAVQERDRRLQHLLNACNSGIDNLPRQEVFPIGGDDRNNVAHVVRIVVPVHFWPMDKLVDEDRGAAFGQEQQGEARRDDVGLLTSASPESRQSVLLAHDFFGAQAVPVVLSEET